MRTAILLAIVMLLLTAAGNLPAACLTTLPPSPAFQPPAPYDSIRLADGMFWYGTEALWTQLSAGGVWSAENNPDKEGGYITKLVFWRRGFDWRKEHEPELVVTANRLDGDAPPVVAHASAVFVTGNTPAIMTGIRIPTTGCWELSAYYRGAKLAFTVAVER